MLTTLNSEMTVVDQGRSEHVEILWHRVQEKLSRSGIP